jgi:xylulose-5-phosphate/fructose-6-phosphate phosphoketolase
VLPILHLNGYKISNPTVLARISHEELEQLFHGYGWNPIFLECDEPEQMHLDMAAAMDDAIGRIKQVRYDAWHLKNGRPRWPMIILRSPKGWTGPKEVDGYKIEGNFRTHQIPLAVSASSPPEHLQLLEDWMKSYHPEELFDELGKLIPELAELAPKGDRRMGANPHANGGNLLRVCRKPSIAMGLQNALVSLISGSVVRITRISCRQCLRIGCAKSAALSIYASMAGSCFMFSKET